MTDRTLLALVLIDRTCDRGRLEGVLSSVSSRCEEWPTCPTRERPARARSTVV